MSPHPSVVPLLFGSSTLPVEIPASVVVDVIRKPPMPRLDDPVAAVREALARPVGMSDSLTEFARGATSACIAICDITRPVPNHLFLRPIVGTLRDAGVPQGAITIIVATGLHRPNTGEELRELVGDDWVLDNVTIANHDATCDADHVDFGTTDTRGTPVRIDRRFAEADVRIATGLVEPHFMAGYSGGRKVIAPGLAHAETIRTFHNHAFMSDPAAANCNLQNNPLHEEQLEILHKLGGALALNTVLDEDRRLSLVNFGEITRSHAAAVDFVRNYCLVEVEQRYDVVVTSAAGSPLDRTYYQTVKGMVGASEILMPGGDLFVVAECAEGLGSPDYRRAQQQLTTLGDEGFLRTLAAKPLADIDEWQSQMQTKATQIGRVHLYSMLDAPSRALTGVETYADRDEFQRALCAALWTCARIAVIPEGPYVIPRVVADGA